MFAVRSYCSWVGAGNTLVLALSLALIGIFKSKKPKLEDYRHLGWNREWWGKRGESEAGGRDGSEAVTMSRGWKINALHCFGMSLRDSPRWRSAMPRLKTGWQRLRDGEDLSSFSEGKIDLICLRILECNVDDHRVDVYEPCLSPLRWLCWLKALELGVENVLESKLIGQQCINDDQEKTDEERSNQVIDLKRASPGLPTCTGQSTLALCPTMEAWRSECAPYGPTCHPLCSVHGTLPETGRMRSMLFPNCSMFSVAEHMVKNETVGMSRELQRDGGFSKGKLLGKRSVVWVIGGVGSLMAMFSGINGVLYYTPQILEQAGVGVLLSNMGISSDSASLLISAVTTLLMLPCIAISMRFIDISGRRRLLLTTIPVLIVSLIILVLGNVVNLGSVAHAAISTISVVVYFCFFVMGFGPIPNILCSEIFPTRVRGLCIAICALTFWICDIIVTYTLPLMLNLIGLAGVFGIYAVVCFISLVFVFLKVPETKGMPLEVISEFFAVGAKQAAAAKND
ncbi:hypothetical protein HHK36_032135 [Tetracentron sinense]|uniref:Major facilitator superfamily (MFS) profile domain-containing protein n=1 Tax=Tetracentron sinense TaxID=13715 RepID=A0A835D0Q5_TETSI|nr:hypothetical protein HHK36_032135 [Tetracentron sinense]